MNGSIIVDGVSKWFGLKVAVSDVTVEFEPGVTGLLGPNGAGKTTLMRIISGLQVPSQGSVAILGTDPRVDVAIYEKVALVPEDEAVYERMTARSFIELAVRLTGLDDAAQRAQTALETVELVDSADRKLGGFSKGMRQRTKVAAALVTEPEVLLLDEPLNGADPVQRAKLIKLFKALGDSGRTVVVSSHVLTEVERMSDRVVAMVDGRLAAVGNLHDIRSAMTDKPRLFYVESEQARELAAALMRTDGVLGVHLDGNRVRVEASDAGKLAYEIPMVAVENQISITAVVPVDESLESVFRYLVHAP